MSIGLMKEVFERSRTKGAARLVLLAMADNASDEGYCWPAIRTIAKKANVTPTTAKLWLRCLMTVKVIEATPRFTADGRQTSNGYTLHPELFGQDEITKNVVLAVKAASRQARDQGAERVRGGGNTPYPPVTRLTPSPGNAPYPLPPVTRLTPLEPSLVSQNEASTVPAEPAGLKPSRKRAAAPQPAPIYRTPLREIQQTYERLLGFPLGKGWAAGEMAAAQVVAAKYTSQDLERCYHHFKRDKFWRGKRLRLAYVAEQLPAFLADFPTAPAGLGGRPGESATEAAERVARELNPNWNAS